MCEGCPARAGIDRSRSAVTITRPRLPRASGDRPRTTNAPPSAIQAAPRERGSTYGTFQSRRFQAGCPARAGIDPPSSPGWRLGFRLPRASGDRPRWGCEIHRELQAAPRERGSTHAGGCLADRGDGCPARAGIDPHSCPARAAGGGLPRASGDRPSPYLGVIGKSTAAPRERGSTLRCPAPLLLLGGCPARAGIDPRGIPGQGLVQGLPRASGDRPLSSAMASNVLRAAPRERGSTRLHGVGQRVGGGCPARAGIDPRMTR